MKERERERRDGCSLTYCGQMNPVIEMYDNTTGDACQGPLDGTLNKKKSDLKTVLYVFHCKFPHVSRTSIFHGSEISRYLLIK